MAFYITDYYAHSLSQVDSRSHGQILLFLVGETGT